MKDGNEGVSSKNVNECLNKFEHLSCEGRLEFLEHSIKKERINDQEFLVVSKLIGSSQYQSVSETVIDWAQSYRDLDFLVNLKANQYISKINCVLK